MIFLFDMKDDLGLTTHENVSSALEDFMNLRLVLHRQVRLDHLDAFSGEFLSCGFARVAGQASDAVKLVRLCEGLNNAATLHTSRTDNDDEWSGGVLSDSHGCSVEGKGVVYSRVLTGNRSLFM